MTQRDVTAQGFRNERLPKVAEEVLGAIMRYLEGGDEMYLMDAYRLLKDEVGE